MNCLAYCTAASYPLQTLHEALRGHFRVTRYKNVLHREMPTAAGTGDVFYFDYGSVVCWGLDAREARQILIELKEFERQPITVIEEDDFCYEYGQTMAMDDQMIVLPDREVTTRLAVSHGIAQSVKLGAFEDTIGHTFTLTKHIPEQLAKEGKISLSRKEIRRKMGELFLDRSSINLHVDVLDTPEFFWDHDELKPFYQTVANHLELTTRVEVLNQKLDVVHELFDMLGNELHNQHSSRLEWIIIWLILIEVNLVIFKEILGIF